ncbi:hypothetical protein [Pseudorhodoplanes sp.]|uniref:hypothetical protein n=1 Tax=Pseudorhodoplanes sp. TaxID=1934341 RepID=UPI003D0EA790
MLRNPVLAAIALSITALNFASPSFAGGLFLDVPMTRVFVCEGPDARMEIYVPQSVLLRRDIAKVGLGRTVNGLYALDLTGAQKGKVIEPVRLRSTRNNRAIVMEQFTRKGLTPATIPLAGGILDFDRRFGTQAKCEAFRPS